MTNSVESGWAGLNKPRATRQIAVVKRHVDHDGRHRGDGQRAQPEAIHPHGLDEPLEHGTDVGEPAAPLGRLSAAGVGQRRIAMNTLPPPVAAKAAWQAMRISGEPVRQSPVARIAVERMRNRT